MAQGSVGGGSQNGWKQQGIIYQTPPPGLSFEKTHPTGTRKDSEYWVADTPVKWKLDVSEAEAITANVNGTDMLVTLKDPDKPIDESNIDEYHPLITFFNEVMARLMQDNQKGRISDLKNRQKAIELWNYLEEKYLHPVTANGPI